MKFTTPPPKHDAEAVFPFLNGKGRKATRLHPRKTSKLSPLDSKIGGAIAWPENEPVPICEATRTRAVPVLQLRKVDVPLLVFSNGADLLQLLWFPQMYEDWGYQPRCLLFWRRSDELSTASILVPEYVNSEECFERRNQCAIHPEVIVEYPPSALLSKEEQEQINEWESAQQDELSIYDWSLSACPGNKVGGYPTGQDLHVDLIPRDRNGEIQELLVTLSDDEWDGGTWPRWKPVEIPKLPDNTVRIDYADGSSADVSRSLLGLDEVRHVSAEERDAYWEAMVPLGTYLKNPLNVFIDRSEDPPVLSGV